ncbi:MAG: S8 family serine peptidase, partial [Gammaproteobacteria bacterium]|nr:S8 family serine peptidase [Gammaproteobacteria bacterium]
LPAHPDIAGSPNLVNGFDMISSAFTANDGDGRDGNPTDPGDAIAANECFPGSPPQGSSWHGTHVAGTVGVGNTDNASGVAGTNWNSSVQAVRVLGKCGGSISDINDGIRWAAGLPVPGAPSNPTPARVINMSLGAGAPCSASPSTQSAINDAVAAGVTVVVAAGNEASDAAGFLPASCDNVITVAAGDFRGHLVSRYSNFGATVEIMAPGGDTQRDDNGDGNPDGVLSMVQGGFAFFNGTSMASPHVAGVAGLLLAQDSQLTPQQVTELIINNAQPRSSQQCPRPCGAGLLNANIRVSAPPPPPPPPPPPEPVVLSVVPTVIDIDEDDTAVITVTVTQGGAALADETVSFVSVDSDVATVAPDSDETDSAGRAQATVTGVNDGDTEIVVRLPAQTQTAAVRVEVAVASALGWNVLLALLALAVYRRFRLARPCDTS